MFYEIKSNNQICGCLSPLNSSVLVGPETLLFFSHIFGEQHRTILGMKYEINIIRMNKSLPYSVTDTLSLKLAVGSELECNRTATLPESELTLIGVCWNGTERF